VAAERFALGAGVRVGQHDGRCEYIAFLAVKNGVVARVFSDDASAADWVSRSGSAAQSAHDGNS
jgi:hypothetical protein